MLIPPVDDSTATDLVSTLVRITFATFQSSTVQI